VNKVKDQLRENYKMKDLGVVNHIIGCETSHCEDTGITYMYQYQFAKSAVKKFCPEELSPCYSPGDPAVFLSKSMSPQSVEEKGEMAKVPYREAVDTLLWLSFGTRPDICYAVSKAAR